jgi:tetratricopeptide (TPR) repeat protein
MAFEILRHAFALFVLTASAAPHPKDDVVAWCEQQWRIESASPTGAPLASRSPREWADLEKRWQTYAPKCAGTVAYEFRVATVQMFGGDIPRARRTLASAKGIPSPSAYLVKFGLAMCDYWELTTGARVTSAAEESRIERAFQETVDGHADFAEGWAMLGSAQTIRGRHDLAVESLQKALQSSIMDLSGVYRNITISYAALRRYGHALDAADEAYTRSPAVTSDPYFVCALAAANTAAGRLEDAEMELKLVLAKNPWFRSEPEFQKAVAFLREKVQAKKSGGTKEPASRDPAAGGRPMISRMSPRPWSVAVDLCRPRSTAPRTSTH